MMMDHDQNSLVDHVSRLLNVYGQEAVECLQEISVVLQRRLVDGNDNNDDDITTKNNNSNKNNGKNTVSTTHPLGLEEDEDEEDHHQENVYSRSPNEDLLIAGNVENIVLQTMKMEQDEIQKESVIQAGLNVLRYWSTIFLLPTSLPSFSTDTTTISTTTTTERWDDRSEVIDLICELMTKYSSNEQIQEDGSVWLSNQSTLLLPPTGKSVETTDEPTPTTTTDDNHNNDTRRKVVQRVMFPILQAMNWHKNNITLWNAGMIIMTRVLVKTLSSSADDLRERQSQVMSLIEMTGGLSVFFLALSKKYGPTTLANKNTKKCKTITVPPTELKTNVCQALMALILNHPENQALVVHQPSGLSILLDTMKLNAFYLPLQQKILPLLASLAYGVDSKPILLAKGGLDCILTCMKDHTRDPSIQATGCRAIANLFAGTSTDIRTKGSLCIKPTLRALRMHPPNVDNTNKSQSGQNHHFDEEGKDEEEDDVSVVQVHFYGCAALRNLSKVHARAVIEAGGITTLIITLGEYHNRPAIQEQAWGAMYLILKTGTPEDCYAFVVTECGLQVLLQTIQDFTKHLRILTATMGCLAFLSAAHSIPITEQMLTGKTLDVVLSTLHRHHKRGPSDLLQHGCRLLTNICTDYPDAHLPLMIKNGVNIMIVIVQQAKNDEILQLEACRVIRELCRDHDNLLQLTEMTSNSASLTTLLGILTHKPKNLQLIECSIEILDNLSILPPVQKDLLLGNRLDIVLQTLMVEHPNDEGILQSGISFFTTLATANHDATLWMKNHDMVFWLQGLHMRLPRRSSKLLRSDVHSLLDHLRTTKVLLTKFGNLIQRNTKKL